MRYAFEWLLSVVVMAVIAAFFLSALEAGSKLVDRAGDYGLNPMVAGSKMR